MGARVAHDAVSDSIRSGVVGILGILVDIYVPNKDC